MFSKIFCKNIKYNSIPFEALVWLFGIRVFSNDSFLKIFLLFLELTYRQKKPELISAQVSRNKCIRYEIAQIFLPSLRIHFWIIQTLAFIWHTMKHLFWCFVLYADFVANRNIFMLSIFVMCPLNSFVNTICTRNQRIFSIFLQIFYHINSH